MIGPLREFDSSSAIHLPTELLCLTPLDLKEACDLIAHDLLGDAPRGQTPSHQVREAVLSQVLFESISRQQRKEGNNETR
jgi:hypothetical protein